MRAGMLGGTFDPPHLAHLVLAAAARHALDLERVVLMPAGEPWRKRGAREVSPAAARLRMTEAATEGLPWLEVSDLEMRRAGPTFTSETVEALAAEGGEWWFLMGSDALVDMPHWHEPGRIVEAARLGVASRGGERHPRAAVSEELRRAVPGIEERIDGVPMPLLAVSSTELRARVREGRPTELLLPEAVRAVVDELGLYR